MKKILLLIGIAVSAASVSAQISPYSLTPDWYFGAGARLTFPTGNFRASGAPTTGFVNTTHSSFVNPEASTSISQRDGSTAIYTNTTHAYNGTSVNWGDFVRNFNNSGDNTCASSSTGGSVAFPDPASPDDAFYVVLANDMTGGNCAHRGVHWYRFTGTGTTVGYDAGPVQIETDAFAGEAITAGTDGNGGYWLVLHYKGATNTFRVWHFTATGITGPTDYTPSANVTNTTNTQSYLKISPCQDKIAYHSGGILVVHEFDRTTGEVGNELRRINTSEGGVGLEFSPDGNRVYYCGAGPSFTGGTVHYFDIATGTGGSVAGSASWSMQLGPDGRIYTSPTGNRATPSPLGIIDDPDGAPSYSTTTLPPAGGSAHAYIFRGLSNIVWLSPERPAINMTDACPQFDFSYNFQTYFLGDIDVASVRWDFDDGDGWETGLGDTPSHTYTAEGSYTVRVEVTDAYCGHTWISTIPVEVDCDLPVELLDFSAQETGGNVALNWSTVSEVNNDYFIIERSYDGQAFSPIGQVAGNGTTNTLTHYDFTDHAPGEGVIYYRLAQYDFDGSVHYSQMVSVHIGSPAQPVITPNPSNSTFTITGAGKGPKQVTVYDVLGRTIEKSHFTDERLVFGARYAPGMYIVQITDRYTDTRIRVVKE